MTKHLRTTLFAAALLASSAGAGAPAAPSLLPAPAAPGPAVQAFVKVAAGRIALVNVNLIDGLGTPARRDQTILIDGATIVSVGPSSVPVPAGYRTVDLGGRTVFPGIVGMHDHLFYVALPNIAVGSRPEDPVLVPQMTFSAPRLYLAGGVTTIRTAGSVEPYADLNLKQQIDAGLMAGPNIDVTAPYVEGKGGFFIQMHGLEDAAEATNFVNYWADRGATSIKAYMNVTRAELGAAIKAAHRRNMKVTGHLCAVTYPEAIALGIDNLEHGFFANTQLDPGKVPDVCPPSSGNPTLAAMDPEGPEAARLIKLLVDNRVALTSTLPIFEQDSPRRPGLPAKAMEAMAPAARESYLIMRNALVRAPAAVLDPIDKGFRNGMALERKFAAAGGLLMAGSDPTGNGGIIPGFSNQRGIELLVEAGFTPEEAIRVATYNGARFLGVEGRIGSIAVGRNADIVVVTGDPSKQIRDIRQVETVFKNGVGYDPQALLNSVRGRYGQY
jgi:imidazolonepropionase-like amidohydrolase